MSDDRIDASRRRLLLFGLISPMAASSIGCAAATRKRIRRVGLARKLGTMIGHSLGAEPPDPIIPPSGPRVEVIGATNGSDPIP